MASTTLVAPGVNVASLPPGAAPAGSAIVTATGPIGVPTKAPTGQTSTAAPTTVVSSQPATTAVANMTATAQQSQQDILNQQSIKAANAANEKAAAAASAGTAPVPTPKTPEQQIADTPDTGNQWAYDASGARIQVPVGSVIPPGYSATNPTVGPTAPVLDQTTDTVGNTYKQYSDGTYGKFNALGTYVGTASQTDFSNSKNAEGVLRSLEQVVNGTYPLTADQQAQIDGVKSAFAALIAQQQTANANFTGATTVAENLYGMGSSLTGLGEIKGSIDAGISKIADLNSKLASSVAAMMTGFKNDDLNLLKSAYEIYSGAVKSRQDEIDKLQATVDQKKKDADDLAMQQKQLQATTNNAIDSSIRSVMDEAGKGGATPEQIKAMNTALANHDYAGAVQAAGTSLQDPTSNAGMYSAYMKKQISLGLPYMLAGDYIAGQKYKEAYAAASATAAAQGAYTESDKNQSKLEHQLQQAALSSRSDLGIQNKKVSTAIDLRTMLNQYKDANGNYNVPATNYTELALGLATLLSPTGVPAQSIVEDLQQPTAKGSLNAALTYASGTQWNGTTQDVLKNLSDSIDRQGQTSEVLRNQELAAQTPSDLDPSRAASVVGKLPSYDKMSNGDIAYQSPEQIADTAKTSVQSLVTSDPSKAAMIKDMLAVPGSNYVTIAQKLGLLPTK